MEFESKVQNAILKIGAVTLNHVTFDDRSQEKVIHDFINMSHQKHSQWNSSCPQLLEVTFCQKLRVQGFQEESQNKKGKLMDTSVHNELECGWGKRDMLPY